MDGFNEWWRVDGGVHPIYNLKMLYFFIIKQGFSDQHHNCAFFSFFHLTWRLCPLKVCMFEFYLECLCGCVCLNQSNLIFLLVSIFILGQKVEIRCDIVCPLNHPNNTTVNGESVSHLFCFSDLSLLSFFSCNDQCFRCRSLFRSFYSLPPSGCTVRFHVHMRSIPNNGT